MENSKKKNIVPLIVGGVLIVGLIVAGIFLFPKKQQPVEKKASTLQNSDEGILPTVGAETKVELTATASKKEAILKIQGVPAGTETVEYELSYQERQKGLQGVIGTIQPGEGNSFEKQITLGTCSSGKCVYHDVMGTIKVTIKFSGTNGEQMFEKEYSL